MDRREILKSTVAVAAATSALGMTRVEAWQPQGGAAALRTQQSSSTATRIASWEMPHRADCWPSWLTRR